MDNKRITIDYEEYLKLTESGLKEKCEEAEERYESMLTNYYMLQDVYDQDTEGVKFRCKKAELGNRKRDKIILLCCTGWFTTFVTGLILITK